MRVGTARCARGLIRGHQWSSVVIRGHRGSSVVIRGHQWPSGVIRGHQCSSVVISGHQSPVRWARVAAARRRAPRGAAARAPSDLCTCGERRRGRRAVVSTCMRARREAAARARSKLGAARARSKLGPFVHDAVRELAEEGVGRVVWDEHLPDATRDQTRSDEIRRDQTRSDEIRRDHAQSSGDQRSSEVIRRSSEVIRGHQRSSEVIKSHQRSLRGHSPSCPSRAPQRWRCRGRPRWTG